MLNKQLIIVGAGATAELAFEYFMRDSGYEVIAFAVERQYIDEEQFLGLPVIDLEDIENIFSPDMHDVFVAVTFAKLNRIRTRLTQIVKSKGYQLASYVSTKAFVWDNVKLGEHCFILEDNTVQPYVEIGDNVVLWSGNHIGHHSRIQNNCFVSSHVVIAGFCDIGENTFLGVNSAIADDVKIGKDNWIGPGLTILKNTDENLLFGAEQAKPSRVPTKKFFKIKD